MLEKKIVFSLFIFFIPVITFAQDTTLIKNGLQLNGYIDFFYRYDLGNQNLQFSNNYTSYTNYKNSLILGTATIDLNYIKKKSEAKIEFAYGSQSDRNNTNSYIMDEFYLKRAYFSYIINQKWNLTIGKLYTYLNDEDIDIINNNFYTVSYIFSNTPSFFVGVLAEHTFKNKQVLSFGITEDADQLFNTNNIKNIIVQWETPTSATSYFRFNYQGGYANQKKYFNQFESFFSTPINKKLNFNASLDYNFSSDPENFSNWVGFMSMLLYKIKPSINLNWRGEAFYSSDPLIFNQSPISINQNNYFVHSQTLASKIHVTPNIVFIPEIKFDWSTKDIFVDAKNTPTNTAYNMVFALYYSF